MSNDRQPAPHAGSSVTGLGTLVPLLFLRMALLIAGGVAASATTSAARIAHGDTWSALALNLVVVAVDLLTLGVVATLLSREGSSLRRLFGRPRPRDFLLGLAIGLLLVVALLAATFLANLLIFRGPPPAGPADPGFHVPLWFALWCILPMPVTVAFAEEALYRGYLQPRWGARIGGWPGLLLVAAAFGLQHVAFALFTPEAAASRALANGLLGVLLGVLFRKLGRLWPLVVAHWLLDVLGLGLPLLLASLAG